MSKYTNSESEAISQQRKRKIVHVSSYNDEFEYLKNKEITEKNRGILNFL